MSPPAMKLEVQLPSRLFDRLDVQRVVVETTGGSLGLLPHRLDLVAALTPGILVYQCGGQAERYMAVDAGVLVKTGFDVRVSVRRAVRGTDLAVLREAVTRDFLRIDEREQSVRAVLAKLETDFLRRLVGLRHD